MQAARGYLTAAQPVHHSIRSRSPLIAKVAKVPLPGGGKDFDFDVPQVLDPGVANAGTPRVWEMSWAPDGRTTFEDGEEVHPGQAHIIWRQVGTHSIFRQP
jgi:hypothetical protein